MIRHPQVLARWAFPAMCYYITYTSPWATHPILLHHPRCCGRSTLVLQQASSRCTQQARGWCQARQLSKHCPVPRTEPGKQDNGRSVQTAPFLCCQGVKAQAEATKPFLSLYHFTYPRLWTRYGHVSSTIAFLNIAVYSGWRQHWCVFGVCVEGEGLVFDVR